MPPLRRPNLTGAYGVPTPPPPASVLAHPDRVMRFLTIQRIAWAVRLGAIGSVLLLLYAAHLLRV